MSRVWFLHRFPAKGKRCIFHEKRHRVARVGSRGRGGRVCWYKGSMAFAFHNQKRLIQSLYREMERGKELPSGIIRIQMILHTGQDAFMLRDEFAVFIND